LNSQLNSHSDDVPTSFVVVLPDPIFCIPGIASNELYTENGVRSIATNNSLSAQEFAKLSTSVYQEHFSKTRNYQLKSTLEV
jgi:hypothetical protein